MLSASLVAHADTLVVSGEGHTYDFTLPDVSTVNYGSGSTFFTVPATETNNQYTIVGFGSTSYGSDLGLLVDASGYSQIDFAGSQLFTVSGTTPTLLTGTFAVTDLQDNAPYTITISSVTPEPSSIALLGTGMLGLAGVVRKRFA